MFLNPRQRIGREAVDATPPGHPGRAMYLSNFGAWLRARFERTGDVADLYAAIQAGREGGGRDRAR
ncbi:MAG TPA: hypothetical protein VFE92_06520 [Dermatophilaceae bacterium]|nr:hypothetical protein [Dermatophilaceae bacterium]